jgi:signal peptidase II
MAGGECCYAIVLSHNYGVSFGVLNRASAIMPYALSVLAFVIVGFMVQWLRRVDRWFPALAIGMIIGGALGNVIDRLRLGPVTDFLYFHYGAYDFPAFNVADSGISVGVTLLVLDGLVRREQKP